MNDTSTSKLLTVEEVQRALGCGRVMVFRLVAQGRLPSVKFGRRRMFRAEDVEALLEDEARRSVAGLG